MTDLLIATSNPGKLREYGVLLADVPARLLSLRDVGLENMDVEEPYETFIDNAVHKARSYAQASGLLAFADDSGLQVDALGGRPGVYSARYGGPTDADRYMKLLGELEGVPDAQRAARFVCIAAAADPQGRLETGEGIVEGRIAQQPGDPSGGFGYDAVFIPEGWEIVFSELPGSAKHDISHRGRAARALIPALKRMLAAT
jgi:XTP/dITP diphosphohydrolase